MSPERKICKQYDLTLDELDDVIARVDGAADTPASERDKEISDAYLAALEAMFDSFPEGWERAGPAAITTMLLHDELVAEGIDPDMFKAQLKGEI